MHRSNCAGDRGIHGFRAAVNKVIKQNQHQKNFSVKKFKYLLQHNSARKLKWDVLIMVLVIYTVIVVPVDYAFDDVASWSAHAPTPPQPPPPPLSLSLTIPAAKHARMYRACGGMRVVLCGDAMTRDCGG